MVRERLHGVGDGSFSESAPKGGALGAGLGAAARATEMQQTLDRWWVVARRLIFLR